MPRKTTTEEPGALSSPVEGPLYDLRGAAAYLRDNERHVRRLYQERRIGFVRNGRKIRFRRADLDAYIAANHVSPVDAA